MIRLVCGYKRTGKDTLVKMFNQEEDFNWVVYHNPETKSHFKIEPVKRVGFADKLREEVNLILDISEEIDYDTFKETVVRDNKTYRDFLIEHAAYRRGQNIDYWVERAAKWNKLNNNINENTEEHIMITDWRYPNESEYLRKSGLDVITIRVFRSEVPVPPDNIISEHQLDNMDTDFLLVPRANTEDEFGKACELFPQYQNFVKQKYLCIGNCCVKQ